MIRFENISKRYRLQDGWHTVISDLTMTLPSGQSMALLGRNGAGKSTLLQMIAGNIRPDTGRIVSDGTISFPIGYNGSFHPDLTGAQNTRFLARIYGVDTRELEAFTEDFAEIGKYFHMPVRFYSSGMLARLNFGISMGIRFDTYLIDEVTAVGDATFRAKSQAVFRDRIKGASAILVSHNIPDLQAFCNSAIVLDEGVLHYYRRLDPALQHQRDMMERARKARWREQQQLQQHQPGGG